MNPYRPQQISGLLISVLLLAACADLPAVFSQNTPTKGSLAPDFGLQTLDGERLELHNFRGEVVVINFWATWCAPCRLEMPALESRYQHGDFEVLAVNFDESVDLVQAYATELGLSFPILLDPGGQVQRLYEVRGYPSTFFIDRQGFIRIVQIGFMDEEQLDANLRELGVEN